MALITEIWQYYPAADDYHACTFPWSCWWSALLFFSPQQTKMRQDLLDHPVFVDETQNLHQSTTLATKKRGHLPDFFITLKPDQRRDFLRAEIVYDNYLAVLRFRFLRLISQETNQAVTTMSDPMELKLLVVVCPWS
jgi:hypothetical protein